MSELVVIVPSRGRPEAARTLTQHFRNTCTAKTFLIFAVDQDDPSKANYEGVGDGTSSGVIFVPSHTMVEALNMVATYQASTGPFAIGFMGDDHCPRTVGWDRAYLDALHELGTGIVYGNDLLQGERIPTQCAMTSDIIQALGYMAPPALTHLFVDDAWKAWGEALGRLRYLPDVIVEHVHPITGKVAWDEGHERVNAPEMYQRDADAFALYRRDQLSEDVAKLRQLPGMRGGLTEGEWRLFEAGTIPAHTTPEWYAERDHAPHLEQEQHRGRLLRTASLVKFAARSRPGATLVDLGAGDGGLLSLVDFVVPAWGYDLQPTNLEAAKVRRVDVRLGDVVVGDIEWGTIAVATEMLEHLIDPHAFVRHIAEHANVLVCSSPWTERPGTAYEFHTWAWDLAGYKNLVEQGGFQVIRQDVVGPFQILLAAKS